MYLYYDKKGFEPDYPILAEGAIKRGNKLEKLIIEEYNPNIIDLSKEATGIYTLQILYKNKLIIKKVIKN